METNLIPTATTIFVAIIAGYIFVREYMEDKDKD
jgi:hypothetical protein